MWGSTHDTLARHPTAGLPGNVEGAELGAEAVQEIEDRALQQLEGMTDNEHQLEPGSGSSPAAPRNTRGPDTA